MPFRCADCGEQSEAAVDGECPSCGARVRDAAEIADALEDRLLARSAPRSSFPVGMVVGVMALVVVIAGVIWLMSGGEEEPQKKDPGSRRWLGPTLDSNRPSAKSGAKPKPKPKPKPKEKKVEEVLKEVVSISDPRLRGLLGIARGRSEWSFFSHTESKVLEWRIDPGAKQIKITYEREMSVAALWEGHVLEGRDAGSRLFELPAWTDRGKVEGMAPGTLRPAGGTLWIQEEGAGLSVHREGTATPLRIPSGAGKGSPELAGASEDSILVRFESSAVTYRFGGGVLTKIKTHAPGAFGLSPAGRFVVSRDDESRWVFERLPDGDVVLTGNTESMESGRAWYSPGEKRAVVMVGGRLTAVDLESGRVVGYVHNFRRGLLLFLGEKRFAIVERTRVRVFEIELPR